MPADRVFLTGASSGIGLALAREYLGRGATVGLVARRREALAEIVAAYPTGRVHVYPADVRDAPALKSAAQDFVNRVGPPTVVIANAGVSIGTLTQYEEDIATFQEIMDINVLGMVKSFQPFIQPMTQAAGGNLVGIASVAGFRGIPGSEAYSASKAATISYLESLRNELKPAGIRVLTICPGYIKTPMTAQNPYPMPFLITAEDAARRMVRAIDGRRSLVVIPWQMAIVGRILRVLPNWLFDAILGRAAHKPRRMGS